MSLIGALFGLSCTFPIEREVMETFILLENGGLFEAKFIKSDEGVYKGQGKLSLNRWYKSQTPLSFAFYANDVDTIFTNEEAQIGINRLQKVHQGWNLKVRSEDFNASGVLYGESGPSLEIKGWNTSILGGSMSFAGWASGAKRSAPINGNGTIVHLKGPKMPTSNRMLFLASGDKLSLGIDHHPPKTLSWGTWEDLDLTDEEIEITETKHGFTIHSEAWSGTFIAEERLGETDPYDHLYWPERVVSSTWINDNIEARYSGILVLESGERKARATVVLRRQEDKPLDPSIKAAKKLSNSLEPSDSE